MKNFICFLFSLFTAGCIGVPNEKLYCQDEQGNPVEGALLVCMYQHTNDFPDGINYYLSDANGIWHATNDNITRNSRSAPRGYLIVYSEKMHSGGRSTGLPKHVLQEQNQAFYSIYTIRPNQKIDPITVFKDGSDDPIVWMESLNILHKLLTPSDIYWGGKGKDEVKRKLKELYTNEVTLFVNKFGFQKPNINYVKYYNIAYSQYNGDISLGDSFKTIFEKKRPIQ